MWLQYCSAFACSVLFFRQLVGHAATAATALHVLVTAHTGHIWSYLVISGHIWSYLVISGHIWSYLIISGHTSSLVCCAWLGLSPRTWISMRWGWSSTSTSTRRLAEAAACPDGRKCEAEAAQRQSKIFMLTVFLQSTSL